MKSNSKDDKNDFTNANEFGESSEDSRGFFESSSTLNNETSYKSSSTPSELSSKGRLRSRKMQQQVSINVDERKAKKTKNINFNMCAAATNYSNNY
jgi:hypothetical protein